MIQTQRLTKRFRKTVAVDDLSIAVEPGRVTGFLGPNGSGKSTTMRMIMGLDRPTRGSVTVNGKPYRKLRHPLREIGALLDADAVHPGRSAFHHLLWMAQANGIPRARVEEVLGLVGLSAVAGKRVGAFSLGMRQRLGIAGAMLGDPGILMLDEPMNGLDPEGILWVRTLMKSLAAQGRVVFASSHLMNEMQGTADHVVVIGQGRLIADASLKDFVAANSLRTVRLRTPHATTLAPALEEAGAQVSAEPDGSLTVSGLPSDRVGDLALAAGAALHELWTRTDSLEAVFMKLTHDSVEYQASPAPAGA
ncbi:ABC transporter ATP-binding protein [Thermoactinospora rubra]|uniref:ABC transporter ATP-binding protein n=1 Tax=Thermoactinospora rubra TaxID=1088767 RepID=UPI000A11DCC1|nr:ABC transporter ATP-binding protein [Thermoactinospora rubra]